MTSKGSPLLVHIGAQASSHLIAEISTLGNIHLRDSLVETPHGTASWVLLRQTLVSLVPTSSFALSPHPVLRDANEDWFE